MTEAQESDKKKLVIVYAGSTMWKARYERDAKDRYPDAEVKTVETALELERLCCNSKYEVVAVNYGGTFVDKADALRYARGERNSAAHQQGRRFFICQV